MRFIAALHSGEAIRASAMAEPFFGSSRKFRIEKHIYQTRELALNDVPDQIDTFYNPMHRHCHLGGVSPEQIAW